MDFTAAYSQLRNSPQFKAWKDAHQNAYLAHFLTQLGPQFEPATWSIGFYDPASDRITTFIMNEPIAIIPDEEVFKKEKSVGELQLSSVTLTPAQAVAAAHHVQQQKYPQHPPTKGLAILQQLDAAVWNITFITASFAALNIKLNASTGAVESDSVSTFFDLQK